MNITIHSITHGKYYVPYYLITLYHMLVISLGVIVSGCDILNVIICYLQEMIFSKFSKSLSASQNLKIIGNCKSIIRFLSCNWLLDSIFRLVVSKNAF